MDEALDLDVIWPSGHKVRVHVVFEPGVGGREVGPTANREEADQGPSADIGPNELASRATLDSFLAGITRTKEDGGTTEATCWEERKELLYERLGITGHPDEPVEVPIPADA